MMNRKKSNTLPGKKKYEPKKKNKIVYIILVCLIAATGIFIAVSKFSPELMESAKAVKKLVIKPKLSRIALFTLKADSGRTNGLDGFEKLKQEFPNYKYEYYDVETDIDVVNRYRIDSYPVVLFLTGDGYELSRSGSEAGIDAYIETVEKLQEKAPEPIEEYGLVPEPGSELVSLYLVNKEDGSYAEIKQFIENKTLVKTTKVSAIRHLFNYLELHLPDDLYNPVPEDTRLESINLVNGVTIVTLSSSFEAAVGTEDGIHSINLIANILIGLGDEKVQIKAGNYTSPIIEGMTGTISNNKKYAPDFQEKDWTDWSPSVATRHYNFSIMHMEEIKYLPCFCGCVEYEHDSVLRCFYETDDEGLFIVDKYGEYNEICQQIIDAYVILKTKGESLMQIRRILEEGYRGNYSTKTPLPQ